MLSLPEIAEHVKIASIAHNGQQVCVLAFLPGISRPCREIRWVLVRTKPIAESIQRQRIRGGRNEDRQDIA